MSTIDHPDPETQSFPSARIQAGEDYTSAYAWSSSPFGDPEAEYPDSEYAADDEEAGYDPAEDSDAATELFVRRSAGRKPATVVLAAAGLLAAAATGVVLWNYTDLGSTGPAPVGSPPTAPAAVTAPEPSPPVVSPVAPFAPRMPAPEHASVPASPGGAAGKLPAVAPSAQAPAAVPTPGEDALATGQATGREASTPPHHQVDQTGTASPQSEAAQ